MSDAAPGVGPRDILFVLFKHLPKALAVFLTIAALTLLVVIFWPSKYRSEAKIKIAVGLEDIAPDPATARLGQLMPAATNPQTNVNSEAETLKSRTVIEQVVNELGGVPFIGREFDADATKAADDRARAMQALARNLDVRTEPLSAIIQVSYDSSSDTDARTVLETYLNEFQKYRSSLNTNPQSARFNKTELEAAQLELSQLEAQLVTVQNRTKISDPEAELTKLIERTSTIRAEIDQHNGQLAATISTISSIEGQLKTLPQTVVENESQNTAMSARDELQQRINQLKLEEQDLRSRFLPDSPAIQIVQQKIAEAQKLLEEARNAPGAKTVGVNPIYRELQLRLETARSEQKALQARLMSLQGDLETASLERQTLNNATPALLQLKSRVDQQREKVADSQRAFDRAQLLQNRQSYNLSAVNVTQPATIPLSPVSPNRPLVLMAGLIAAALAALATAMAAEGLDGSVSRPEQLQRLGVSRVSSIPTMDIKPGSYNSIESSMLDTQSGHARYVRPTNRPGLSVQSTRAGAASVSPQQVLETIASTGTRSALFGGNGSVASAGATPAMTEQSYNASVARAELDSAIVETGQDLIERLLLVGGNDLPKTIAVVGVQPASGATTVAVHMAAALTGMVRDDASSESGRVLLIDGNLVEPGVEKYFTQMNDGGLSQWLSGGSNAGSIATAIRRSDNIRLDVLPAGSGAKSQVGRLNDAIEAAAKLGYRSIIVDLPALSRCETSARIAGVCEATVLVADYGKTNRQTTRQMLSRLRECGASVAGAVLNRREFPVPQRLYNLF
jgi:uncharacterized protein involved in exopolysaccharide biosynthesis/Mrp family chromosome partitioning ATPase